jgi:hypothetical protein
MLTFLGFGPHSVAMVNSLFTNALTFVFVSSALSPWNLTMIHSLRVPIGSLSICVDNKLSLVLMFTMSLVGYLAGPIFNGLSGFKGVPMV